MENQENKIKLSESECLWRPELKVVTDEEARMNVSVRANKISAQGTSNGSAGPNMRTEPQQEPSTAERSRKGNGSGAPRFCVGLISTLNIFAGHEGIKIT